MFPELSSDTQLQLSLLSNDEHGEVEHIEHKNADGAEDAGTSERLPRNLILMVSLCRPCHRALESDLVTKGVFAVMVPGQKQFSID